MKFIDLFAGIGGFHLALHSLGAECVFASEIDAYSRKTYEANFKKTSPQIFNDRLFNKNILEVKPEDIPDFDILCAGFPCQPFSQAGYKKGFQEDKDSRGQMFFQIAKILKAKRPKAFFLENVRNLINHDNGKTFKIIKQVLGEDLRYDFYYKIIKACDYGLPQLRPRVYIIGFDRNLNLERDFVFPPHKALKYTMSDILGGECTRDIGLTIRVGGRGSNICDRRNWDSYEVEGEVKKLTVAQARKMMGLPLSFQLPVSKTQAWKQLGNSVAVDAIKAIGKSLLEHLERPKQTRTHELSRNLDSFFMRGPRCGLTVNPANELSRKTFGSICTGGGIYEQGLIPHDIKPIWGIEIDRRVADVYRLNYPESEIVVDDVCNINWEILPRPDYLHASPSCRSFSLANSKKENNKDIDVAKAVCSAIAHFKPEIFTLENVPKYQESQSWQAILCSLTKLGYKVEYTVQKLHLWGVPQKRRYRFIAIATLARMNCKLTPTNRTKYWYEEIKDLIPSLQPGSLSNTQKKKLTFKTESAISRQEVVLLKRNQIRNCTPCAYSTEAGCWTVTATLCTDHNQRNRSLFADLVTPEGIFKLNTRCLARIQTIPDSYKLSGECAIDGLIIGDGVPPYFVEQMWEQILDSTKILK